MSLCTVTKMPTQLVLSLPARPRTLLILLAAPAALILAISAALTSLAGANATSLIAHAARYFDADGEANLWSWYSGLIFTFIGIAFAGLVVMTPTGAARRAYCVLAVLGFYLSADEIASLHELLFQPAEMIGLGRFGWVAVGIPVALAASGAIFMVARAIDPVLRRRLVISGAVFLAGAVGLEAVNEFLLAPFALHPWSPLALVEVTIEEGLEFGGTILALDAAMQALISASGVPRSAPTASNASAAQLTA